MIQQQSHWLDLDSSKFGDYMRCPRRFFYRHILGWVSIYPNLDLEFGEAWHRAKAHIFVHGTGERAIEDAMILFLDHYRKFFGENTDLDNEPKSPGNALRALMQYGEVYGDPRTEYTVINIDGKPAVEVYGHVPISEKRVLHFRLDAITQRMSSGLIRVWDHKTSKANSPIYQSQYIMSFQMSTYYHLANCLYTPSRVQDLCVDLTILRKGGNDHIRLPIMKDVDTMSAWLWEANHWYDRIEADVNRLLNCKEDARVMTAFPKNDKGCIMYNRKCSYFDYCIAWANPLARCDIVPEGLEVKFWNPAEVEKTAENVVSVS